MWTPIFEKAQDLDSRTRVRVTAACRLHATATVLFNRRTNLFCAGRYRFDVAATGTRAIRTSFSPNIGIYDR